MQLSSGGSIDSPHVSLDTRRNVRLVSGVLLTWYICKPCSFQSLLKKKKQQQTNKNNWEIVRFKSQLILQWTNETTYIGVWVIQAKNSSSCNLELRLVSKTYSVSCLMRSATMSVHFTAALLSKFRLVPGNSCALATGTAKRAKDFWEKPRVHRATFPLYEWTTHKGLEQMPGCLNTAKRLLLVRRFCVIYTPTILFIRSLFSSFFFF